VMLGSARKATITAARNSAADTRLYISPASRA
jgi:hypothetical protein